MNSLKRLYISIKGQIDQTADEFENHEALAGVAIQDLQEIAGKTRLQLHRVTKMTEQYQQQLEVLEKQQTQWTNRAIKVKDEDQDKALQCVKRLKQTKNQIKLLEQQFQASSNQENKIRQDLNAIQQQLLVLNNKKQMLASRQNRIQIQEVLQSDQTNPLDTANQLFERWEGRLVSSEFDAPADSTDSLSDRFEQEEEALELKMMLDELSTAGQSEDSKKG